jgi:5-methylcytosine-specific restriction endonuclease McrA
VSAPHGKIAGSFLPPLAGATAGAIWLNLHYHQPAARTGEVVFPALLAGLLIAWPLLVITVVFFIPAMIKGAVIPHQWRANYRYKHGRQNAKSAVISEWLRRVVLRADRHRCVSCGSRRHLQIDHVMPWDAGGLTALPNLMTLCAPCNNLKSDYWNFGENHIQYHYGPEHVGRARRILAKEKRRRLNPLRWTRAAWALAA